MLFGVAVAASVLASNEQPRIGLAVISAAEVLVFGARRWFPLAVVVGSFGLSAVSMGLDSEATGLQFMAMLLSFGLAGALTRGRDLVVAAIFGVALIGYGTLGLEASGGVDDFLLTTAVSMAFLAAGWQISQRDHLLAEARQAGALVAAAQRERTRKALAEERARIARELHDVVSHGLSVVVVQAQAARASVEDLPGDSSATTRRLNAVEATAREALGEMRRMLGLLQIDDLDGLEGIDGQTKPEPPTPGLADLPGLVDRAHSAGLDVVAELPETSPPAGAGVQLAAYRIVQESLTNALRHARGAQVSVQVAVGPTGLEVCVRNAVPSAGSSGASSGGQGLVGMRERARTYGGHCDAGRTEGGHFEVHAVLPLEHHEMPNVHQVKRR